MTVATVNGTKDGQKTRQQEAINLTVGSPKPQEEKGTGTSLDAGTKQAQETNGGRKGPNAAGWVTPLNTRKSPTIHTQQIQTTHNTFNVLRDVGTSRTQQGSQVQHGGGNVLSPHGDG